MNFHNSIKQMSNRLAICLPFSSGRQKSPYKIKPGKIEAMQSKLIRLHKMESIGQLVGGIAHDFNNILTTVIGFADLIEMEGNVDDTTMDYVYEIQKSGKRAASLTQQLLAFSVKQILKPELVNLNSLVRDAERMLKVLLLENITLTLNLSQHLDIVRVDPGQIVQVLMNLVINARDAMPHGGQIIIETENIYMDKFSCNFHPEIVPGDYIVLTVSDTGCGISPELLEKVFEPFFTNKGVGKGTGLGLSTVMGIIKQSAGYIYTYSELYYGTSFKIYLPKAKEAKIIGKEAERVQVPQAGNERILFVEDDRSLRKIISKILFHLGYKVYQSGSGEEALSIYNKYKDSGIDLLVSDIIMSGMNGCDLAETILEGDSNMKILYISGYTDDILAAYGFMDVGVSFLPKPFSIFDIATKIRNILDKN